MDGDLAELSDRELQRLAYARTSTPEQQAHAAAAGEELARRAAAVHAEHRAAEQRSRYEQTDQAAGLEEEHPEASPEDAHHRRMRTVGLAGVLLAALALPGVGWALSLPNPDPLAIFDGQRDPADVAVLAELIGQDAVAAITSGPQLVRLDDDIVAIAFRASTVPDGRSTVWDAYCLLATRDPDVDLDDAEPNDADLNDAGAWQLGGNCVTPERFEEQGIEAARRPIPGSDGLTFDWVVWGPEGAPQITQNRSADAQVWGGSVTDALAFAGLQSRAGAAAPDIDGADRLVMGPAQIASSSTRDGGTLSVSAYLIESAVEGAQGLAPQYCLLATVDGSETSTECAALPLVEREGLSVRSSSPGENWLVEVGPDGSIRFDGF